MSENTFTTSKRKSEMPLVHFLEKCSKVFFERMKLRTKADESNEDVKEKENVLQKIEDFVVEPWWADDAALESELDKYIITDSHNATTSTEDSLKVVPCCASSSSNNAALVSEVEMYSHYATTSTEDSKSKSLLQNLVQCNNLMNGDVSINLKRENVHKDAEDLKEEPCWADDAVLEPDLEKYFITDSHIATSSSEASKSKKLLNYLVQLNFLKYGTFRIDLTRENVHKDAEDLMTTEDDEDNNAVQGLINVDEIENKDVLINLQRFIKKEEPCWSDDDALESKLEKYSKTDSHNASTPFTEELVQFNNLENGDLSSNLKTKNVLKDAEYRKSVKALTKRGGHRMTLRGRKQSNIKESPQDVKSRNYRKRFSKKDKLWKCDCCGRGYEYKYNLKRHKKYECNQEGQFPCTICHNYRAKYKITLNKHLQARHGVNNE